MKWFLAGQMIGIKKIRFLLITSLCLTHPFLYSVYWDAHSEIKDPVGERKDSVFGGKVILQCNIIILYYRNILCSL